MAETCLIEFPGTEYSPVELGKGVELSTELTAVNSPVLFGCRSGLCGTCLIELESEDRDSVPEPEAEEAEALEVYAPGNSKARLACQLRLTTNLSLTVIPSA